MIIEGEPRVKKALIDLQQRVDSRVAFVEARITQVELGDGHKWRNGLCCGVVPFTFKKVD